MFICHLPGTSPKTTIEATWTCEDLSGEKHAFTEVLDVEHRNAQPDWQLLRNNPPYPVNPIKTRERLFGREAHLDTLLLRAAAGTSTVVWGQKRVGKTSLLQVIHHELSRMEKHTCIFLRMGQLAGMHEGQLAHTIASRILAELPSCPLNCPSEAEFGAGMGRLVPVIESITNMYNDWRIVIIIDEFDDLDPSFYIGERGKWFVKALRSLSEIGLTFLFAGSERMNVIFMKHSLELNKWTNAFVDSTQSVRDCQHRPSSVGMNRTAQRLHSASQIVTKVGGS